MHASSDETSRSRNTRLASAHTAWTPSRQVASQSTRRSTRSAKSAVGTDSSRSMARMCGVKSGTMSGGALVAGIGPGVRVASASKHAGHEDVGVAEGAPTNSGACAARDHHAMTRSNAGPCARSWCFAASCICASASCDASIPCLVTRAAARSHSASASMSATGISSCSDDMRRDRASTLVGGASRATARSAMQATRSHAASSCRARARWDHCSREGHASQRGDGVSSTVGARCKAHAYASKTTAVHAADGSEHVYVNDASRRRAGSPGSCTLAS